MDQKSTTQSMMYTIVIPLFNEEENIAILLQEIEAVMSSVRATWEVLLIDDASTDHTAEKIRGLANKSSYIRTICFKYNQGQSAAFAAGFKHAKGRFIITMDGDCQNDPKDIPRLIEMQDKGDLIIGWRVKRQDTLFKRWISKISNAARSYICQDGVHDTGCSLKLMKREALFSLPTFKGMHRFLPALFVMEGRAVVEVPVNHRQRERGKSKYHFFNRLSPLIDLFVVWWMQRRWIALSKIEYRQPNP